MIQNPYTSSQIDNKAPAKFSRPVITTLLGFVILFINIAASNGLLVVALFWPLFKNIDFVLLSFDNFKGIVFSTLLALSQNGYVVSLTVIVGASCAILFVWYLGKRQNVGNLFHYLNIQGFRKKDFALWFSIYVIFLILSEYVGSYFNRPEVPEFMKALICNPGSYFLLFIAIAVAAPIFEEVLFRGYWFQGYMQTKGGPLVAILVPNLIWASIHLQYDLYDITQVFIIGLILGASRLYSRSLALPILLHMLANSIAFFASLYAIQCN